MPQLDRWAMDQALALMQKRMVRDKYAEIWRATQEARADE